LSINMIILKFNEIQKKKKHTAQNNNGRIKFNHLKISLSFTHRKLYTNVRNTSSQRIHRHYQHSYLQHKDHNDSIFNTRIIMERQSISLFRELPCGFRDEKSLIIFFRIRISSFWAFDLSHELFTCTFGLYAGKGSTQY
jgi:hypothetical protein